MSKYYYGWRRSNPDHRDHIYSTPRNVLQKLPSSIDLDPLNNSVGVPFDPCWDQGALGCCGPSSLAENILYDLIINSQPNVKQPNKIVVPSRLFSYYTTRELMDTIKSDSGVDNRTMLKALNQFGWCNEDLCPYDITKFEDKPSYAAYSQAIGRKLEEYSNVPQSSAQMKGCLAGDPDNGILGRPFIFGFTVYESFESDEVTRTGVVPLPAYSEKVLGGHDVLIMGYNDLTQLFKFKNHYSDSWGDRGYGYIPYSYAINPDLAGDFWCVKMAYSN